MKNFHFQLAARQPRRAAWAGLATLVLGLWSAGARSDIQIEIEGVDEAVRANVLIFLSLQRYRERDDLTADTVELLHERAGREVRQALRPFGYYQPTIQSSYKPLPNGQDWSVYIRIDPGAPVMLTEVTVATTGPGGEDGIFRDLIAASPLKSGARLNHGTYEKLKGDLQRTAVSVGYLEAQLKRNQLIVDPKQLTASAHLELETGPRYRFGRTTIEQDAIDPELVERFLRYQEGDYFDTVALLRTQFALDDSQYFSTVEVSTGTRDATAHTVPISIQAQPIKKNKYSIAFGYGTDTRWRGTLAWENRRINRSGHRSYVELVGASNEQRFEARYVIPVGDPALEKLSLDGIVSHKLLADLDINSVELRPGLTQIRGRWQRVLFASATRERTESLTERRTDTLLIPGISFALLPESFAGQPLVLGRGFYAELIGSHSAFGSDADFLRFRVQDDHVFDLSPHWHLLLRGELGTSFVANFSELPGSQRFFAGGDQSVRGFGLNELSPVDANGEKVGGRHLVVGSVEVVRDLPRNFGIAAFFDAGNAVNKFGDPLEYSVGVGFRWRLPVVTLGIDIAQAISRSDLGPRLHLNISPQL